METKDEIAEKKAPSARPKAQPGKFPVHTKVTMQKTAGERGTFLFDEESVNMLSDIMSFRYHAIHEGVTNVPMDEAEFRELVYRMMSFLMARKLSTSIAPGTDEALAANLSKIAKLGCEAPSAIIQFIDLFGQVDTPDGAQFRMLGQPLLAWSFFYRAVTPNPAYDRRDVFALNERWIGHKRMLFDYCVAYVNSWADRAPPFAFDFGNGNVLTTTIPKITRGVAAYRVFVNAVPKTDKVERRLRIAATIEPFLEADLTQLARNALIGAGVSFVNWSSYDLTEQYANYLNQVQPVLAETMSKKSNWVPIMMMKSVGCDAQLLKREAVYQLYSPIALDGKTLDLGWLVAGPDNHVVMNHRNYSLTPEKTKREALTEFVNGMIKN